MTDLNIIRWLAQDAIERSDDFRRLTFGWSDPTEVEYNVGEDLSRHYWITVAPSRKGDRRDELIGPDVRRSTLGRRGVMCIDIPSWESTEFHTWWQARFLAQGSS